MAECKYCKINYDNEIDTAILNELKSNYDYKTKKHFGAVISIEGDKLNVWTCANVYEPAYVETSVKINFCPMCGRQLNENVEAKNG